MEDLYKRIEDLCKDRDQSILGMCKAAGIGQGIMSDLKSGRSKSLSSKTLQKLSVYFGVSVAYLLGETDEKRSPAYTDDLTPEEALVIKFYREASPDIKLAIQKIITR